MFNLYFLRFLHHLVELPQRLVEVVVTGDYDFGQSPSSGSLPRRSRQIVGFFTETCQWRRCTRAFCDE